MPSLALALAFVATGFVIFANLGAATLDVDEVFQIFAARSLNEGHGPRLPSGVVYDRGVTVTHLVAASLDAFGDSELTARLPTAVFGMLSLAAFAGGLWWLAGPYAAVWGVLLLGFFPEFVYQSRHLRFYTYTLFFSILAMFTGWQALRPRDQPGASPSPHWRREWGWSLLTVALLLVAVRAQVVTLSVLVGFGVAVAAAGLDDVRRRRSRAIRESGFLQMTLVGLVGMIVVLLIHPAMVGDLWERSQFVAPWTEGAVGDIPQLAYYYMLAGAVPALLALAPVAFVVLALRRSRLAAYLAIWVGVPLLLHSLVFPWKGARFVLAALPGLFAAVAIAAAWGSTRLKEAVQEWSASLLASDAARRGLAGAVVALAGLFAVVVSPGVQQSWDMIGAGGAMESRRLADLVSGDPELRALPVGAVQPFHTLYYAEKLDFTVAPREPSEERKEPVDTDGDGEPDYWMNRAGVPVLTTPESIDRHFNGQAVLIVTGGGRRVHPELRASLQAFGSELCEGRCGPFELYYLP